ncbi:hypothetical protein [Paenibacillus amylolyticus]|uniref:hypothetical protein n=1 Tax=Paenibacillus amylolyticus TaxID=1451 RepID=UPI0015C3641C|nr:hypothetical protein [Paenibacillus amylolyticus]
MQNRSEEAERSPESFLQESCIGSISYHRIFPFGEGIKKSGDNSDRKMVLQLE